MVSAKGRVGYAGSLGDNDYPFFKHFYSGGLSTVRGFESNSLGPRDSENEPYGGDFAVNASAELIFPVPFAEDTNSMRTLLFTDVVMFI